MQRVFCRCALLARLCRGLLGVRSRCSGLGCRDFLFGATACFPCGFLFRRQAGECRSLGDLFGACGFGRQCGGVLLGGESLLGQLREFLFGFRARPAEHGQFHGGEFAALGIDFGLLLGVDAVAQGDFGAALGIGLLHQGGFGPRIGFGPPQRLVCREFFRLLTPHRRGRTLRGDELATLRLGAGLVVCCGADQGHGRSIPVGHDSIAVVRCGRRGIPLRGPDPQLIEQGRAQNKEKSNPVSILLA